jgi:hypothetical protein
MLDALKPLLTSKKFQTAVLTLIANLLLRFGVDLDIADALALTSPLIAYILGQSAVDVKKAGPSVGGAALVLLAAAGLSGAAVGLAGCGAAQRVGGGLIDCMAPHTAKLAGELTGVVADTIRHATDNTGKVDWQGVRGVVERFKSDGPRCAFRIAVDEALRLRKAVGGVQSAGLEYSPDDLRAGFAAINAQAFGDRLAPL